MSKWVIPIFFLRCTRKYFPQLNTCLWLITASQKSVIYIYNKKCHQYAVRVPGTNYYYLHNVVTFLGSEIQHRPGEKILHVRRRTFWSSSAGIGVSLRRQVHYLLGVLCGLFDVCLRTFHFMSADSEKVRRLAPKSPQTDFCKVRRLASKVRRLAPEKSVDLYRKVRRRTF